MRTKSLAAVLSVITVALLAQPAVAAEDGFKFPNLNPFRSQKTGIPVPVRNKPEPTFSLPKLPSLPALPKPNLPTLTMPKLELPSLVSSPRRNEPSSWTRLNSSTKKMFAKTKSVLMPWSEKSIPVRSPTGSNLRRVARQPKKPSLISNWFGTRTSEPTVNSVNDYLALPRPTP